MPQKTPIRQGLKSITLIWWLKGHGNLRENTFGDEGRSPDYSTSISVHTVYAFYKNCTQKLIGLERNED